MANFRYINGEWKRMEKVKFPIENRMQHFLFQNKKQAAIKIIKGLYNSKEITDMERQSLLGSLHYLLKYMPEERKRKNGL